MCSSDLLFDIKDEPLIFADKKSRGYEIMINSFIENKYRPNIIFTTNEPYAFRQLVQQKAGLGICPSHFKNFFEGDDSLVIRPFKRNPRQIYLAYSNTRLRTPNEKLFIEFIMRYYKCNEEKLAINPETRNILSNEKGKG